MAEISFKGKVETMYFVDDTVAYQFIRIPVLKRNYCDMNAFRVHSKYGAYANSDLFPGILARIRKEVFGSSEHLRLDQLPDCVSLDTRKFLAVVKIDV